MGFTYSVKFDIMRLRLFVVKRSYLYESGCRVTLFAVSDECENTLSYLSEVIETSIEQQGYDKSIEYFEFYEISKFENWAENVDSAKFVDGKIEDLFFPSEYDTIEPCK
jgi:hypothetical protein